MKELFLGNDISNTYGDDLEAWDVAHGIGDGEVQVGKECVFANGLSSFRTSGASDYQFLTGWFSARRSVNFTGGSFLHHFVVVTISQDNEDVGSGSANAGRGLSTSKHVSSINDTRGDGGTHTAARSSIAKDNTLGIRGTLQGRSSGRHGRVVISLSNGHRSIPGDSVEVGDSKVNSSRRISETSHQVFGKLLFQSKFSFINGG